MQICNLSIAELFDYCCAVKGVLDLPEGQEVAVIGTLYKDMKLKPSILGRIFQGEKGQLLFNILVKAVQADQISI